MSTTTAARTESPTRAVPATTVLERHYPHRVAHVFRAWADPHTFAQWYAPSQEWVVADSVVDFRVGGRQMAFFGPPGAPRFKGDGRFEDIVANARIVSSSTMHGMEAPAEQQRMSTTICAVEFIPDAGGTRLILTDHSVFYTWETPDDRREGWGEILSKLDRHLKGSL